jgi:type IV pilus assembly protein PilY1
MKSSILIKLGLACAIVLAGFAARAEDIDIYGGISGSTAPNVLIIVDNTSSNDANYPSSCPFSASPPNLPNITLLDMVYCSVYGALDAIKTQPALLSKLNVGLMSGGSGNNKGGQMYYPNASPYNLPLMDTTGIANFESIIAAGIPKATGNAKLDGDMQEAWAWLTGTTGPRSGTSYAAHIGTHACQKTFIILIGAASKQGRPDNGSGFTSASDIASAAAAAGATTDQQTALSTQISTANLGSYTSNDVAWIDEWARFLNQSNFNPSDPNDPQNVITYTIAAGGTSPDYNQILKSTAIQGGGKSFVAGDYNSMVQALLQIFNEVQAVNSVFASASLPVSTNAQGTYLNQVFMGTFRPDAGGAPRWMGNLKQYQLGVDTSNLQSPAVYLADASWGPYQPNQTANAALSSAGTGFISPTAISFWTSKDTTTSPDAAPPTGTNGFWVNHSQGAGGAFDSQDGEFVEKGGVSQQIRLANLKDDYAATPAGPRNVYTCLASGGTTCATNSQLSSMPFATTNTNITAAILGTNGPAMAISSIARSNNTATVTLASAPSPALTAGQSITIAGSTYREFNGSFSIAPLTPTTFSYSITVDPPTPSTGTYSASVASNPIKVTSLTRSGTTVTATTSAAHGYVTGQTVTIAGATGSRYNGSFVVTNTGATTFTYTISDGPATPDGGGKAAVGSTSYTIPGNNIVRSASNSSNVSNVTVTLGSTITFSAGNTVTISGAGPGGVSSYNGSWTITNTGTACAGGSKSGNKPLSFCFNITTTPASPDPGTSATADGGTSPLAISGLAYTVGPCSANAYSTVAVTATTATAPSFVAGSTVSIGGTVAANESPYVGTFKVVSVKTSTPYNFTYNIQTSPGNASGCTDTTSGMTASAQGITRDSLINWVRGSDNIGDESSPGGGITVRPSVHGDVLHSRPAVINYGNSTGVVVFYGANDGMFRAVNGNQPPATNASPAPMGTCKASTDCAIGGIPPGGELWSFVPPEFYSKLARLYNNSPIISMPTTPTGILPTPQPKNYFFDGTPSVYQNGSTAYIFLAARRGGPVLYALDVSSPASPKFMWKHTNQDTGFSELGQTWSQPKVAILSCRQNPSYDPSTCDPSASPPKDPGFPVLVFGAGYDANEDFEPPGADTVGRGIFILDAVTGNLLWSAKSGGSTDSCSGNPCTLQSMTYAMPADVTLVDRDFDGFIDRIYAADLGGNIWRVDLKPSAGAPNYGPSSWQTTLLAALGGTGTTKRKFFFPPDVVLTKRYDVVLAVSGDREHPLSTNQANNIVNRFYMVKDTNVGMSASGWTAVRDDTSSTADAQPPALFNATSATYTGTLSGFYVTLLGLDSKGIPSLGEKGVNAPTTVGGLVHFGTNQPTPPSANSCKANLGTARSYAINFLTGATTQTVLDGGGLAPSPVFGVVTINVNGKPRQLPFLIGAGGGGNGADSRSSIGAQRPDIPIKATRKRTYWYRDTDQ